MSIPIPHYALLPPSSHRLHPHSPSAHYLLLPPSLHKTHNLPPPGPVLINNRHGTLYLTTSFFQLSSTPPIPFLTPCLSNLHPPLYITPSSLDVCNHVTIRALTPSIQSSQARALAKLTKKALKGRDAWRGDVVPVAEGVLVVVVRAETGVVNAETSVEVELGGCDVKVCKEIRMSMRGRWRKLWWCKEVIERLDACVERGVKIVRITGGEGDVEDVVKVYAAGGMDGVRVVREGGLQGLQGKGCTFVIGNVEKEVLERVEVEVEVQRMEEEERRQILGCEDEGLVKETAGMCRREVEGIAEVYKRGGYEGVKEAMKVWGRVVQVEVGGVQWEDIGGMGTEKKMLQKATQGGVLLYGPPGGGKTLLARALAGRGSFVALKGAEVLDKYVGESERRVREVFERARDCAPCVLFLDEVDALLPRRGNAESGGVMDRVVSQVLGMMDQLGDDVLLVAATNRPDLVDPAALRGGRLGKIVYVGGGEMKGVLKALCRKFEMGHVDWDGVLEGREGLSGADLYKVATEAWISAARRVEVKEEEDWIETGLRKAASWIARRKWWGEEEEKEEEEEEKVKVVVLEEDLKEAIKKVRPSLSEVERAQYEMLRVSMETGI